VRGKGLSARNLNSQGKRKRCHVGKWYLPIVTLSILRGSRQKRGGVEDIQEGGRGRRTRKVVGKERKKSLHRDAGEEVDWGGKGGLLVKHGKLQQGKKEGEPFIEGKRRPARHIPKRSFHTIVIHNRGSRRAESALDGGRERRGIFCMEKKNLIPLFS